MYLINCLVTALRFSDEAVFYHSFVSGLIAGGFAASAVNPIDVVKTRLQALTKVKGEMSYNGVTDAFM